MSSKIMNFFIILKNKKLFLIKNYKFFKKIGYKITDIATKTKFYKNLAKISLKFVQIL